MTALCACINTGDNNGINTTNAKEAKGDSTQCRFSNIRQSNLMQYLDEDGDTCYIDNSVSVFWPELINGGPCDKLQQALRNELVDSVGITSIEQVIKCLLESNLPDNPEKAQLKSITSITGNVQRVSSNNVKVDLQELGEKLLTYHIYYDSYMAGGAHGIYANRYVTYDLLENKVVTLDDIIADTTALRNAILRSIKQEYHYDKDDLFLPENGLLPLPQNFYIDGSVLHAVYQVYEIASYAQGAIDAPIYPYMINARNTKLYTHYGSKLLDVEELSNEAK